MGQGYLRRSLRLTAICLATAGGLGVIIPAAHSACAAPGFTSKNEFRPSETVVIRGANFGVGCDDTGGGMVGVGGCAVTRDPATGRHHPAKNIRVTLSQNGETYLLGIRDANQDYKIRLKATVPAELDPGNATLRAEGDGGGTAKEKVIIKQPGPSQ